MVRFNFSTNKNVDFIFPIIKQNMNPYENETVF